MKKFFYFVAIATVMMTSCSQSDEMTIEKGPEDLKIKFGSSAMNIDVKTRGPIDAQAPINDLQLVRVGDYDTSADWKAVTGVGVVTTATAAWNATNSNYDLNVAAGGDQYYNADPDFKSEFTAYTPGAPFVSGDGTSTFPTASWDIDGKTDIMVSSAVATGTKATTTPLNFALTHKLLQLRFILIADGVAAQNAWGDVTGIEILDSPNSAIVTLPAATMEFPTATPATDLSDIKVYKYNTDDVLASGNKVTLPITTPPSEQAYVMVAPNTVDASNQFKIKVYTEKSNADGQELTVTLNDVPAAGDSYAVTLTFKATIIEFSATMTDWVTTGKKGTGTVE